MGDKSSYFLMFFVLVLISALAYFSFTLSGPIENFLTGKVTAKAYITEPEYENCSVFLYEGMNYVSFNCEIGRTINESLRNENNESLNYDVIYSFTPLSSSSPWRIYHANLPDWVTLNLDSLYRGRGYIIFMGSPGTYHNQGIYSQNSNKIPLREGWNLIAYPLKYELNVTDVVDTIVDSFISIRTYDENSSTWISYEPGVDDSLTELKAMKSYWINVNQDVLWEVD